MTVGSDQLSLAIGKSGQNVRLAHKLKGYKIDLKASESGSDFDAAMQLVRDAADRLGIYLVNSINPFRIEGQKTIVWELLQDLEWQAPDWIVVPAGNLGNTSAFGKALREAHAAGWIAKLPRIASIQARGQPIPKTMP